MAIQQRAVRKIDWWNIGLWAAQLVLALVFGSAGVMKLFMPIETLGTSLNWVTHSPALLVRFIGFVELAGAIGMILPAATRILPWLTPLAALGFAVIQVLAIGVHASLGELALSLPLNLALLALSAFVIWGRTRKSVVTSRS
ncbi:DoxX family protein [Pseudaminobacter sp. NGMCC 1.201702]|uniref:DoxX family protein n=1 Tax=Pseudaminobacter sp. NGMCC 1.201702 TaxID=3391825 RepID=UPI0039EF1930